MRRKRTIIFIVIAALAATACLGAGGLFLYRKIKRKILWSRYDAKTPRQIQRIPSPSDSPEVFVASSLDRIFKDGKTLLKPEFTQSASISLAKNEYEPFQVVAAAGTVPVVNARLEISDLVNVDGKAKIDAKNVSWRVVGYVPTEKPYYPVKYIGEWPDPLLPELTVDIAVNEVQPFWVTVYAPENTRAGVYQGEIIFRADGIASQKIPLQERVYNFILLREGSLKTAFDFYGHETKKRYPRKKNEEDNAYQARLGALNEKYIIAMLKYRINPVLNVDPTSEKELGGVDRYRLYGLNNFSIGKRGGTLGNNWPKTDEGIEDILMQYRTYGEMLKLNRLLDYTYIYTWDEGRIGNPVVAKICSMIHRAYPGLKNMVAYHGFWDPEKDPEWGKDIDIWCFQIDNFKEEKMRALRNLGKEIWMYISGPGGYGTPNLAMDFDSIDYGIVPWLCWKYDIKGFLYWCVNWWPHVDPFKTAKNTRWAQNGNGLLFYPGEDGPIASLRLEVFRDGMEDYEYIRQLMKRLKKIKHKQNEVKYKTIFEQSVALLTMDDSIVAEMGRFTKDGDVLKARRDAIARQIEEFDKRFIQ